MPFAELVANAAGQLREQGSAQRLYPLRRRVIEFAGVFGAKIRVAARIDIQQESPRSVRVCVATGGNVFKDQAWEEAPVEVAHVKIEAGKAVRDRILLDAICQDCRLPGIQLEQLSYVERFCGSRSFSAVTPCGQQPGTRLRAARFDWPRGATYRERVVARATPLTESASRIGAR